jgi:hypothetical protein
LEYQGIVGVMSAMIERVKIKALCLARSQDMNDSTLIKNVELLGEIPLNNITQTWDPLLAKLQIYSNLASTIAEIHPYAKAAYSVVSAAYQVVIKQLERDESIKCLVLAMDDIYSFVHEAHPLETIESHRIIMTQLSQQTIECGYFISEYCADTFATRAIKYAVAPIDAAITEYGRKFSELKSSLLAHSIITTEIKVLRILETVERLG